MGKKKNEEGAPKLIACNCRARAAREDEGFSLEEICEEICGVDFQAAARDHFMESVRCAFAVACKEYSLRQRGLTNPDPPIAALLEVFRDVLEGLIIASRAQDARALNRFWEAFLDPLQVPRERRRVT